MTQVLQVAVALIFFVNKTLVLVGKKVGWLFGAIAAMLGVFYFFRIGLYVFTVLEMGLIILMGYGFLKKEGNAAVERFLFVVIGIVMLALTYFVFVGLMTFVEFCASITLLIGTYYLTHSHIRLGWGLYAVAHALAAIVGYDKDQTFFADFQIASALISVVGASTRSR